MRTNSSYLSTPRVRKGIPDGGEWRPRDHADSGLIEAPSATDPWLSRLNTLRDAGYVSATTIAPVGSAHDSDGVDQWWDQAIITAEYGHDSGDYPQMPDDNSPSMSGGQSLSGHRRTTRIAYTGADLTIRMPSKAAISRFADQNGTGTFDVPVSVDGPGGRQLQGWVRCTPGTTGEWDCQGLGLDGETEPYVAEGVAAILEARHPRQALTTVGDLIERHRAREVSHGLPTQTLDSSSWVRKVGYDDDSHTMMVELEGRPYGYRVDRATFDLVANAYSPGSAFNRAVKGQASRVTVTNCNLCGRFTTGGASHVCPTTVHDRGDGHRNTLAWDRAAELAEQATSNVVSFERRDDTPPAGLLVNKTGEPDRVGVAEWMQREVFRAVDKDPTSLAKPSMFGPQVARGFTAAVASDVEPFCDAMHTPDAYATFGMNGDQGVVVFNGLDSKAAKAMYVKLPEENLRSQSTAGAPTVGNLLSVASRNPGSVELVGAMVPPSVDDERVEMYGMLLYTDAPDELSAQRQARLLGVAAGRGPTNITRVSPAWRDGRQAWLLRW